MVSKDILDKLRSMNLNIMPAKLSTKVPLVNEWTSLQDKKYDGEFPDNCNAAIICGSISNNLFVLDLDDASMYDDFKEYHNRTFIVKSGKGYHLYFRTDGLLPLNANGVEDARGRTLEIQVEGKYVMSPGSFVVPDSKMKHKYPEENRNGFYYKIISDLPVLTINPNEIKEKLESLGFKTVKKKISEIKLGTKEGSRNLDTFKYACHLIRDFGLSGKALEQGVFELNKRHSTPLPESEVYTIINQALGYEGENIEKHNKIIQKRLSKDEPIEIPMHDITPIHEGVPIKFHATIIAVGERKTITKEADFECSHGHKIPVKCDSFHVMNMPIICDYSGCRQRDFVINRDSLVTEYVQIMRIEEFLDESKESTPCSNAFPDNPKSLIK